MCIQANGSPARDSPPELRSRTSREATSLLMATATSTTLSDPITASPYSGIISSSSTIVTSVPNTQELFAGEILTRPEFPVGTSIVSIGTSTITLSHMPTVGYTYPVALPDGESILSTSANYVTYTGTSESGSRYIYTYDFPINSAWTVASITLPTNSDLKIFGMTLQGNNPYAAGTVTAISGQIWPVVRTQEASSQFRSVYGGASMPVTASTSSYPSPDTLNADPRIRPVYEQQQGNDTTNSGTGDAAGPLGNVDYEFSQNAALLSVCRGRSRMVRHR